MRFLTKRQKEVFDYVKNYVQLYGYAPSMGEIAKHFGLRSSATVHQHLKSLEKKKYIKRIPNQNRGIVLTPTTEFNRSGLVEVPVLGTIAAGEPIEAITDDESIAIPEELMGKGGTYVLKVRGNSMIDEQIRDGDFVIIEERNKAENGETVVALINEEEVTLKKFFDEGKRIRLQPANPDLKPIILDKKKDSLRIQGIVIGILRKY